MTKKHKHKKDKKIKNKWNEAQNVCEMTSMQVSDYAGAMAVLILKLLNVN